MIEIKIECGCGQRFAFDVEVAADRIFGPVYCPTCGADRTKDANSAIAQYFQKEPTVQSAGSAAVTAASPGGKLPLRVGSASAAVEPMATAPAIRHSAAAPPSESEPPSRERRLLPGQLPPDRAESEARAKIMWGDDPAEVIKFLLSHGFSGDEAKATVSPILALRAEVVRKTGIQKTVTGAGMVCLPIIAFIIFQSVGFFPLKIFGATLVVGVWGGWRVLSGCIMILSPRSEKGDIADM